MAPAIHLAGIRYRTLGNMMSAEKPEFDLMDESDRGCVIVGAAQLEDDLAELLRRRFEGNGLSNKHIEEMFAFSGPLASFSSKSLVCYGFDLISKSTFDDLGKVRRLRNRLAHVPGAADFLDPEIEDCVASIQCCVEAAKQFDGEMFKGRGRAGAVKSKARSQLPEWKSRSMGFVKYTKAVFCIGLMLLRIQIVAYARVRKV